METKKDYVNRIYRLALFAGLVENKKEFADLLEMERSSVSGAMNGNEKNLTDRFVRRVQKFAEAHHLDEGTPDVVPEPQAQTEPEDWKQRLIESQQRTIESQQRTIEALTQMQTSVPAYMGGVFAPKNTGRTEK